MAELKPCPFCGRIPMVEDCGDNRFFVRCKCGIAQDKLYGQRCDAIRRWNARKPSAQPQSTMGQVNDTAQSTNDYISRQAAIDALDKRFDDVPMELTTEILQLRRDLRQLPSADVAPVRHGHWEECEVLDENCVEVCQSARCSICGRYHTTPYMYYFDQYKYCPNCGARMDGET